VKSAPIAVEKASFLTAVPPFRQLNARATWIMATVLKVSASLRMHIHQYPQHLALDVAQSVPLGR